MIAKIIRDYNQKFGKSTKLSEIIDNIKKLDVKKNKFEYTSSDWKKFYEKNKTVKPQTKKTKEKKLLLKSFNDRPKHFITQNNIDGYTLVIKSDQRDPAKAEMSSFNKIIGAIKDNKIVKVAEFDIDLLNKIDQNIYFSKWLPKVERKRISEKEASDDFESSEE